MQSMRALLLVLGLTVLNTGCSEKRFRNATSVMSPTITPNETVVADMAAFLENGPRRWDVVVFNPPPKATTQPQEIWMMRVIGLPGEDLEIREDGVYINGRRETQPDHIAQIRYVSSVPHPSKGTVTYPYTIDANTYFLVGDNTTNSFDSRFWGSVAGHSILGRVKDK